MLASDVARTVVLIAFVKQVHVDEDGYFSDCPPECDDCVTRQYFDVYTTPGIAKILHLCETFEVRSRKGKVYTYWSPSEEAIEYIIENHASEVEQAGRDRGIIL